MTGQEQIDRLVVSATDPAVAAERHHGQRQTAEPAVETGQRHTREGDRTGAELERGNGDRQPEAEWDDRREHETDPVCLEQLQQRVGVEQGAGIVGSLEPQHGAEHGGRQQRQQTDTGIHATDSLVISGGGPRCGTDEERRHSGIAGGVVCRCVCGVWACIDRRHET